MFTPSILLLMTFNACAAGGAALFALQVSVFEARNGQAQSTTPASDDNPITLDRVGREGMLARAA